VKVEVSSKLPAISIYPFPSTWVPPSLVSPDFPDGGRNNEF
jgi:hypothetical protein